MTEKEKELENLMCSMSLNKKNRCQGRTVKRNRCKNLEKEPNSGFCYIHLNQKNGINIK